MENLDQILEAIFFALGRPISIKEISSTLKIDTDEIAKAFEVLKERYNDDNAIVLVQIKDEYQLVTNKKYYEYINKFVENTKKQNLSIAIQEVLSIIAYNPKITKAEIESIRGVNSDHAVSRLLEIGLVEEVARLNLPGRPAAYSVTNEFLKSCGIKDLSELPDYEKMKVKDEQILVSDIENKKDSETENIENFGQEFKD